MQIISWNVNGLRACARKGFEAWLDDCDAGLSIGTQVFDISTKGSAEDFDFAVFLFLHEAETATPIRVRLASNECAIRADGG